MRERERPELMEDMAADGDDLEILNNGIEIFVAEWANGFAKGVAIHHLCCLYLFLGFRRFALFLSWFLSGKWSEILKKKKKKTELSGKIPFFPVFQRTEREEDVRG